VKSGVKPPFTPSFYALWMTWRLATRLAKNRAGGSDTPLHALPVERPAALQAYRRAAHLPAPFHLPLRGGNVLSASLPLLTAAATAWAYTASLPVSGRFGRRPFPSDGVVVAGGVGGRQIACMPALLFLPACHLPLSCWSFLYCRQAMTGVNECGGRRW